ncbi:MAG: FecR family protein [Candidatus Cryptobacteroides sp.]
MEDRILKFVARYYKAGRLDIDRAFARFVNNAGIQMPEGSVPRLAGRRRTLFAMMPVAAALALFVSGMVLMRPGWEEYRAIDVAQKFTLPDSSVVFLAPGSELKFRNRSNARMARMSNGKVYFNVHRNESVPFSIDAGNGFVRVLGTQFQVSRNDASIRVDVSSGKVLFAAGHNPDGQPNRSHPDQADPSCHLDQAVPSCHLDQAKRVERSTPSPVILTAGISAILDAGSPVPQIVEQGSGNFATWATQEFIFDNTPLEDVVAELSEFYGKEIIVNSPGDWKTKCLTASFAADDIQVILSIISSALDVDMEIKP